MRSERCKAVTFSREAVTFFCKAVTFSREAVTFVCKAVTFSREPPFSLPLEGRGERQRNPLKRWGKRLCWFGGKKLRGGMGDMGGLFSVFTNLRARTRENSYGSPVRYQCH